MDKTGLITNVQHFCYDDGPGVRTTVFFKGCSLRCKWCANPENLRTGYEDRYKEQSIGSITLSGREIGVEELLREVMSDLIFYRNSGGGVTASGGEPLLQSGFVAEFFSGLHERGVTTALETAGYVPWENMERVLSYTDYVFYDIKIMDRQRHKAYTGADPLLIHDNLKRACRAFPKVDITIRIPVIRDVNDDMKNLEDTLELIAPYPNIRALELLEYHRLGLGKYEALGMDYPLSDALPPEKTRLEELRSAADAFFEKQGGK